MTIEDVTRSDLEQLLENQTETLLKEMVRRFETVDKRFDLLEAKTDKIDRRTNEDVVVLMKVVKKLEKRVNVLERSAA